VTAPTPPPISVRPAEICRRLLAALDASEGRRRRRKRNTTPDAVGMALKRRLLEETVRDDPGPEDYEGWLVGQCVTAESTPSGPIRAMALEILGEWRLAQASRVFRSWLEQGAPSDDAGQGGDVTAPPRDTSCTSFPTRTDTDRSAPLPAPPPSRVPRDPGNC
jgi:hypothetical protein